MLVWHPATWHIIRGAACEAVNAHQDVVRGVVVAVRTGVKDKHETKRSDDPKNRSDYREIDFEACFRRVG